MILVLFFVFIKKYNETNYIYSSFVLNILTFILFIIFIITVLRNAWANEDAFITMRVIDNFINGYGLTWNIIDDLAITEPLLARLYPVPDCRIGHFQREIPDGYIETIVKGENFIYEKNLALYYDKLKVIISGENIFSKERLKEIFKMNIGIYNGLIKKYHQNKKENELYVSYDMINRSVQDGTP